MIHSFPFQQQQQQQQQQNMFQFQPLPTWDLEQGLFRAWWFDPLVATVAFAVIINWYWWHERRLGLSTVSELKIGVLNVVSQPAQATFGYWLGIYVWRIVVPPAGPVIPNGIPTNLTTDIGYLALEVVSGIILYDAIFFVIHMAMHELPWLRQFHYEHHNTSKGTLESRDVLRHSFVDASLQVLVNIVVQRYTPWGVVKSRLARAMHNVLVIWFLTESHTASPKPYIWRQWFVGVREHRVHHLGRNDHNKTKNYKNNNDYEFLYGRNHRYQQFFGYLDDFRAFVASLQWQLLQTDCQA